MTNANTNTNASPLILAALEIRKGSKALANGSAMLTIALKDAMDVRLAYTVGDDGFGFALSEYREPVLNDDGTKSSKHQSARLSVIMTELLGEPEDAISDAVKTAFNKAYPAAVLMRFDPEYSAITIEGGNLGNVPLSLAIDLAKPDTFKLARKGVQQIAKQAKTPLTDDDAIDDAVYDTTVECDGSKDGLFGKMPTTTQMIEKLGKLAIDAGLVEPKGSRAPRDAGTASAAKAVELGQAMSWVAQQIALQIDGDEATVALTKELDAKAFTLWSFLGKYLDGLDMI